MMYFVQHLQTYVSKNRAWKKVCDYVETFEDVLIQNDLALDALKEELRIKIEQVNAEHPKLKPIRYSGGHIGSGTIRMDASVDKAGCPDMVFIMDICKVRSMYRYSEKGGTQCTLK